MAEQAQFEELARQLSAVGAVKRDMARVMPPDCPSDPPPFSSSSTGTAPCA